MGHLQSKLSQKSLKSKIKKGLHHDKKSKAKKNKFSIPEVEVDPRQSCELLNGDSDIEAKKSMQDQLAFNSDIFVINQMMMSVQFFGNFERDLWEAIELNLRREKQKSQNLTRHCKTVLLPDRLAEAVDRRVKYVAKHGKFKNQLQPLHTQTLYIVHDNIEITNYGDTAVYSNLSEAPLYKFQIENPYEGVRRKKVLHHAGFVKLKSSEKITKSDVSSCLSSDSQYVSGSTKNDDEDIEDATYEGDNEEEIYDDAPKIFERGKLRDSLKKSSKIPFERSIDPLYVSSPSSSEYDYTYIRALNTHQPLSIFRQSALLHKPISTTMLPETCITTVSRFMINNTQQDQFYRYSTEDDDAEDHESDEKESKESDSNRSSFVYEDKHYLNSKGFFSYFINLFQQTLANELEISEDLLKSATCKGASIYCAGYEIIPAIACPWPRESNEWIYRRREMREDPKTKNMIQWPSLEMVNNITDYGCCVVPQGFAPKVGSNPQREIEWKIVFPEANRYLESRLSPAQIKIYMMTKALVKAFIEPNLERGLNMFTDDHIRNHLFWQCEHNFFAWSEDKLGEGLLKFLGSLLHCIKIHRLPDYFMPKRNLLENIPEKVLVEVHRRIYRIVENPVPYALIAIRNLRYQRDFYPKLKYKKLHSRLLVDDPTKIINPRASKSLDDLIHGPSDDDDDENDVPIGSIAYFNRKERRSRKKRSRCVRFALDDHYVNAYGRKKDMEKDIRRASVESIDTKATLFKHMEILRRKLIYKLFIDQFIGMSEMTVKYQYYDHGFFLLKQATRLTELMVDDKHFEESHDYIQKIESQREVLSKLKSENVQGPELPRRMSIFDSETKRTRYRTYQTEECDSDNTLDNLNGEEEVASEDDNDEIYSYHRSIVAQIHATSIENLARFQHSDECEDEEVYAFTKSMENVNIDHSSKM